MKLVHIGIILSLIVFIVSAYFLFFSKEEGETPVVTTTTTKPGVTTSLPSSEGGQIIPINDVSIYSNRFEPSQLNIKPNEKVKWINKDSKQHEVVCIDSDQTPLFDAILNAGESWEFYMAKSGECWDPSVSEESMRMSITVGS